MTEKLEELKALIGLRMCEGVGDISAFKLLMFCGSASAVFNEKKEHLSGISGISSNITDLLETGINWDLVERELDFIDKKNINYVSIFDKAYPQNLLGIDNPPTLLFFKGNIEQLNQSPCISIVGTRDATRYGTNAVSEIIDLFNQTHVNIISGLAYGIDIAAHKECIQRNISTFGVMGNGIKTIYPSTHKDYVKEMIDRGGGIITEFLSDEIPNRENFPKRNRIIAGISSATIVVEAIPKSGTLITADLALKYNRKVFALPGRYNDKSSEGCNLLLQNPRVRSIVSMRSLLNELGFNGRPKKTQKKNTENLNPEELLIYQLLCKNTKMSLDSISNLSEATISSCAASLFNLEMMGLIKSLPGKFYELG